MVQILVIGIDRHEIDSPAEIPAHAGDHIPSPAAHSDDLYPGDGARNFPLLGHAPDLVRLSPFH